MRGELQNKAVVQVAAGDEQSLCVTEDSSVYSWGDNDEGQLGVADIPNAGLPALLHALDMNAM